MIENEKMGTENNKAKANYYYREIGSQKTGYLTDVPEDRYDDRREAMTAYFLTSKDYPNNIVRIYWVTSLDEEGMPDNKEGFYAVSVEEDRPCSAKKPQDTKSDEDRKAKIRDQLNKMKQQLDSIGDEIFDDGVDAGDRKQNQRFSMSVWTIKNVGLILSEIEIPGVESEVLNALWKKCWKNRDPFYPECKLWHHMEYIEALKEIIG